MCPEEVSIEFICLELAAEYIHLETQGIQLVAVFIRKQVHIIIHIGKQDPLGSLKNQKREDSYQKQGKTAEDQELSLDGKSAEAVSVALSCSIVHGYLP